MGPLPNNEFPDTVHGTSRVSYLNKFKNNKFTLATVSYLFVSMVIFMLLFHKYFRTSGNTAANVAAPATAATAKKPKNTSTSTSDDHSDDGSDPIVVGESRKKFIEHRIDMCVQPVNKLTR